ncbi:MAG: response regulator transcription factor [Chloroflexota bacterium]
MIIRLVLIDDHPVVRAGLIGMLSGQADFEIVGEASSAQDGLRLVNEHQPNVVLCDLRLPEIDGLEIVRRIRQAYPDIQVLVLTSYNTTYDINAAIQAGAVGYLLKDTPREELYRAIRRAVQGRKTFSDETIAHLLPQDESTGTSLSEREIHILERVAQGKTNIVIASELHISEATVKSYLSQIYRKLDVIDRASAVAEALKRHLID